MIAPKPPSLPVIDPTANVLSLVSAAMKRQDDLRETDNKHADDIRKLEERYNREISVLREKLSIAESSRLDAVLAVQKADVALASEKTSATAATLAAQVVSTAKAATDVITTLGDALGRRITTLEQNQYQGAGATGQRGESRQQYQWLIGVMVGIVIVIVVHFWK